MSEIAEDEGRLVAALDRIEAAVALVAERRAAEAALPMPQPAMAEPAMAEPAAPAAPLPDPGPDPAEMEALRSALEAERAAKAQLVERVRGLKQKQETVMARLERRVAQLSGELEQAAAEILRQTTLVEELTAANRALRAAAEAGMPDGAALDRSMQADLRALDALRAAERAEVETVLGEIRRLIGEGADA